MMKRDPKRRQEWMIAKQVTGRLPGTGSWTSGGVVYRHLNMSMSCVHESLSRAPRRPGPIPDSAVAEYVPMRLGAPKLVIEWVGGKVEFYSVGDTVRMECTL